MKNIFLAFKKYFLLFVIALLLLALWHFHFYHYLNLQELNLYKNEAKTWTFSHYEAAVFVYLFIYIFLIACGVPCATILTIIGGFLFGVPAILFSLIGLTLGGLILFFAVRTAFGAKIASKTSGWIKTMEQGFQKNAFHYLLMLRLMPIFPCWVSNASAGALNVKPLIFICATLIGVLPSTIIYALAGRSLDQFLLDGHVLSFNRILSPQIAIPLFGLALLSIFPVFYKNIKNRKL